MIRWLSLLTVFTLFAQSPPERFTDELWQANKDIYREILEHPFLKELTEGTLHPDAFAFYLIQDAHYLREFAKALSITAAKAPREQWAALLNTHAADTFHYERQLHESIFADYGIDSNRVRHTEPAPEAFAYTSFLVATAYESSFAESLAALLPCYWIYWEVGKELQNQGSSDPVYQKWIDTYASEEYASTVKAILAIVNEVTRDTESAERKAMKRNFRRSARYEWMFWDSAYHQRSWPP